MTITLQRRVIRITILTIILATLLIVISIFGYLHLSNLMSQKSMIEILKHSIPSQINDILPTLLVDEQKSAISLILDKIKKSENLDNIYFSSDDIHQIRNRYNDCNYIDQLYLCTKQDGIVLIKPITLSKNLYGFLIKEKILESFSLQNQDIYLLEIFLIIMLTTFIIYFLNLSKISTKEIPETLSSLLKWVESSLKENENYKKKPNLKFHEFNILANQISILLSQRKNQYLQEKMLILTKQVAHDIRSPLSVLNMVTASANGLDKEQKDLIQSSIQRINDIANDLLKKSKNASETNEALTSATCETLLINPLVDSIVTEKRQQFKSKSKINISFISSHDYGIFAHVSSSNLKRIFSNIINNSIEAIGNESGYVIASVSSDESNAIIKITDNGHGIPQHILDKLGYESISYGKENTESGNGLGVLHAKKTIESMNGQFSISSTLGKGTEVTISLPLSEKPSWFLEALSIKEKTTILVCDDDSSIIALWKKRFSDFPLVKINYFTSIDTLKEFLLINKESDFTLLIDYEFSGEQKNGLDFIIENQLSSKSILVTSHYDEEIVIRTCTDHGIKQIPKNICALVPIEMTSTKSIYDAVILDNEDLQVRSWQFAAIQKSKTILVFSKHEDFLAALSDIDHKTPIFIDSILGDNIKGEDIAKQVFDQGFKNVYMSSGHDPSYFKDMTFLKGVIGKTPFFP